ncbi:hypothetical protein ABTE71_20755, partial [Acinetobacter baumannii]
YLNIQDGKLIANGKLALQSINFAIHGGTILSGDDLTSGGAPDDLARVCSGFRLRARVGELGSSMTCSDSSKIISLRQMA